MSVPLLVRCRASHVRIFKSQKRLQSGPSSKPLQSHLHMNRSFLKQAGGVGPLHAAASEGVELSDRRCCEKLVARGRVLMAYVMQRDVAHVLPLRLSPRRF